MQRRERDATYPPWLWITVCVWESCPETGLAQAQKKAQKQAKETRRQKRVGKLQDRKAYEKKRDVDERRRRSGGRRDEEK